MLLFYYFRKCLFTIQNAGGDPTLDSDFNPQSGLAAFTASSGSTISHLDAGLLIPSGTIDGRAWLDVNGDGVQNPGEPGIDGVTVQLLDSNGNVIATTVTHGGGTYSFLASSNATYSVRFLAPSGLLFTAEGQGDPNFDSSVDSTGTTAPFTFPPANPIVARSAGLYQTGSVSGVVWEDRNGDGIRQSGEQLLSGLTVNLLDVHGTVVATTTTGAGGAYSFSGLVPGSYSVVVVAPGYAFTLLHATDPALDSDVDPQTGRAVFTVTSGAAVRHLDAGAFIPDTVSGRAWQDDNGDGIQDPTEHGLANVLVSLFAADGTLVATTSTDANGNYTFSAVRPGSYSLHFGQPNNFLFSPEGQGSDPMRDSDVDLAGNTALFTLLSSDPLHQFDAGLTPLPVLTG